MKKVILLMSVFILSTAIAALAVPASKTLSFDKAKMGAVEFSGKVHKTAGFSCKDCHNAEMFPKKKQGSVHITMKQIYAGEQCGACHDGTKAFAAKKSCKRCHVKKK